MFSTRRLISKSSIPSTKHLLTVTSAPVAFGITITFMFHHFSFSSIFFSVLYTIITPGECFISVLADGLSLEFEWQQVSRTLHCVLAYLSNAIVWMVSTRPFFSKSSSLCINPLVTVPRALITIDITTTLMFHSFFNSLVSFR